MKFNDWYQTHIDQINEVMQKCLSDQKKKPCTERKSEQGQSQNIVIK